MLSKFIEFIFGFSLRLICKIFFNTLLNDLNIPSILQLDTYTTNLFNNKIGCTKFREKCINDKLLNNNELLKEFLILLDMHLVFKHGDHLGIL